MAYDKKTKYFLWKADCLISSFKRRAKKHNKTYDYITKRADYALIIKEKLKGKCEYCSCKLTRTNLNVDHKIPISRGGSFGEDNLAYVCSACNRSKAEMSAEEFMSLQKLILTWADKGYYILKQLRTASVVFKKRF